MNRRLVMTGTGGCCPHGPASAIRPPDVHALPARRYALTDRLEAAVFASD